MAIEVSKAGTVITGEHVELFRLLALKYALKLEMKGIKRPGHSAYATLKKEGYLGNKAKVLNELENYIKMRFGEAA